jgi:thiol-disulfide isomerase/thioredoxin
MKAYILFVFSVAILSCNDNQTAVSSANAAKDSFSLRVKINGVQGTTAKLMSRSPDYRGSKVLDSVSLANGVFTFSGKLDQPEMLSVLIEPGNWAFDVFAENSNIKVEADTTGSYYYDEIKYGGSKGAQVKKITVTGSGSHDDWVKFNNDPALKKYDTVITNIYAKVEAEKDIDLQYKYRDQADSVRKLSSALKYEWISRYADAHPSSVAGVYMFSNMYLFDQNMPLTQLDSAIKRFSGAATGTPYYTFLTDNLAKRKAVSPGQVAPDFTLLKRDSSSFKLSSTRGRYVMLDFWASWCHPCRQAIPHWKKVYAEYHPKGLDIVSVSDDSRWKDWFKAMDVEKMPWAQVCDEFPEKNMPAKVGSLYMTTFIPFYVLLDKEGKILVYSGNEADIDAKLKEVFAGEASHLQ